jgi:hypothetical protein
LRRRNTCVRVICRIIVGAGGSPRENVARSGDAYTLDPQSDQLADAGNGRYVRHQLVHDRQAPNRRFNRGPRSRNQDRLVLPARACVGDGRLGPAACLTAASRLLKRGLHYWQRRSWSSALPALLRCPAWLRSSARRCRVPCPRDRLGPCQGCCRETSYRHVRLIGTFGVLLGLDLLRRLILVLFPVPLYVVVLRQADPASRTNIEAATRTRISKAPSHRSKIT